MIPVGIDTLALYIPPYVFDLAELAQLRGHARTRYSDTLGQHMMAIASPDADIVTMGANAAKEALTHIDKSDIAMLLLATESGIDQSKSAGIYIHDLLQLPKTCRIVELKQACYAGTAALQLALSYLRDHPHQKALVIASDIARYGLKTAGESSQGAGAVAMVLSAYPRLIAFDAEYGVATENVMDFWRPNYLDEAIVEGKYSSKLYLSMLEKTWQHYTECSGRSLSEHAHICYHTPVPRLVETAHYHLLNQQANNTLTKEEASAQVETSLIYARLMGNSYAAALYISLASLLDHTKENCAGKRIGFYSYGSGCVAEFFSGVIQEDYRSALHTAYHTQLFTHRQLLSSEEYEAWHRFQYATDGSQQTIPIYHTGSFRLACIQEHKRIYETIHIQCPITQSENVI